MGQIQLFVWISQNYVFAEVAPFPRAGHRSLLKMGTNFGEFWRIQKIANLSAREKTAKPSAHAYCILLCTVPMRVRGNWPHLACI